MRIRRFNESEDKTSREIDINHILNIARDEGLSITTWDQSNDHGFDPCQYYIDRYPIDDHGNSIDSLGPIVDNEKFFEIIKEIYNRLEANDLIEHMGPILQRVSTSAGEKFNSIFTGQGGNTSNKIEDTPDVSHLDYEDIKYAGILIVK